MRKYVFQYIIFLSLMILALAGCSNLPWSQTSAPTPEPTLVPSTPTVTPTQFVDTGPKITRLNIWLPPQFAPSQDTEAGLLLQDRLASFNQLYPNLETVYRIKAETGPASILESLYASGSVAPLVLPDLVLISTSDMHTAAEQNLIFPYPEGFPAEDDNDWYEIALSLSSYQNQRYLVPIAGDALSMVYDPELVDPVPMNWNE